MRNLQSERIQQHIQTEPESIQTTKLGRTPPIEPTEATTTTTAAETAI
jgi:hypothetical protein